MLKNMTIRDACVACGGTWHGSDLDLDKRILEVAIDSRKVVEGTLFFALPGERVDGHDFIPQVIEQGAVAAVSEKIIEGVSDYILVDDTRKALRDLAMFYRQLLDIKIVGITGSVGKTSTKEMIAQVLSKKYKVQKTAGNFNNEIGLPLTVFTITEEHEVAVLEMGISDFGEMTRLSAIAKPDIMVITNIGQCHLENLGTRNGILRAKTECFRNLNDNAKVVLNGTDDMLLTVSTVQHNKPYFFGAKKQFVWASDVRDMGLAGSDALLHINGKSIRLRIPIAGSHMVMNACAAASVATLLDMTVEQIVSGISDCQAVAGRGRLIRTDKYLLVDDTYNANPVSMKAELDMLKASPGRRVAILGDMFELGEDEEKLHYDVGQYAASRCDVLICIGKLSSCMEQGASDYIENTGRADIYLRYYKDKASFENDIDNILHDGDTVLLKASHGMEFVKLLDILKEK